MEESVKSEDISYPDQLESCGAAREWFRYLSGPVAMKKLKTNEKGIPNSKLVVEGIQHQRMATNSPLNVSVFKFHMVAHKRIELQKWGFPNQSPVVSRENGSDTRGVQQS
jgi:hypothetical protein